MIHTLLLVMNPGELDEFAPSIVRLLSKSDGILPVFQLLLEDDSTVCGEGFSVDPQTAVNKLCTAFASKYSIQHTKSDLLSISPRN